MKKLLACLLVLACALLSACTAEVMTNLTMNDTQPWSTTEGRYEKSVYTVRKTAKNGDSLGSGQMVTVIDTHPENEKISVATVSLTFTNPDGSVDTVESKTTFLDASLYALTSEKTYVFGNAPQNNFRFTCTYSGADASQKEVKYYKGNETEPCKTLSVSSVSSSAYDNESLYYLIRAFEKESENYGGNFNLVNLYDCYLNDRVSTYSVYYRTKEDINLADELWTEEKLNGWGFSQTGGKLPCYQVFLSKNGKPSGTPIEYFFLTPSKAFVGGKKKVLLKVKQPVYSATTGILDHTTEYVLTDFSVVKA